jgi:Ca-activated chloride channel family protein
MDLRALGTLAIAVWLAAGCASEGTSFSGGTSAPRSSGAPRSADYAAEPPREESETSQEQYDDVGTNPFTRPGHDPFSTFAADVDTASYDIFVRDIGYESLPDPRSVRLEEFVNYFDYEYPTPEPGAETPFDIDLQASSHPMDRELAQLRVGIQAEAAPESQKKPSNLVFLVDVSGSMQDSDKLPLVKELLRETLQVLAPTDTVSIVTYASSTGVVLEPTEASNRNQIDEALAGLAAGGSTNGSGGIQLAYDQAESAFLEGGFNHVILCTDGDFNVGVTSHDALVELIEEKRGTGITLTALGFGRGNLNDAMMERVSNAGNGIYSVITSEDHAQRYAQESMLDTVTHVAKDMKIQVEFNAEHVQAYRLLGYENRAIADDDFRDDQVDAGEVGAGHRVTALYELVLDGQSIPQAQGAPEIDDGEPVEGEREIGADELVQVRVRYKEPDATAEDPAHEVAEGLSPEAVLADPSQADASTRYASAVAAFAEILKESPYADEGELDGIESIFEAQSGADDKRGRMAELFGEARRLLGQQ